jgi:N-acetylmuramoyl-L-alanine amidase
MAKASMELEDDDIVESKTFEHPSPNFDERDPAVRLEFIVIHYTGMLTREAALQYLCTPAAKVSAHYLIDEDGREFRLVDEKKRAWHAGKSFWRGITDMNSASIGIELVNRGHAFGYTPFPAAQIAALLALLQEITKRHKLKPAKAMLGHADIAPTRKEDPGELFPWQELAREGFGLWPQIVPDDYAPVKDNEEQTLLRALGYDCPESGLYDPATRSALLAFQRRYDPDNLTGTPERETVARLRALLRMTTP